MAALAVARACQTAAMDGRAADVFTKDFDNELDHFEDFLEKDAGDCCVTFAAHGEKGFLEEDTGDCWAAVAASRR